MAWLELTATLCDDGDVIDTELHWPQTATTHMHQL